MNTWLIRPKILLLRLLSLPSKKASDLTILREIFLPCNQSCKCDLSIHALLFAMAFHAGAEPDDAGDESVSMTLEEAMDKLESSGIEVGVVYLQYY